MSLKRKIFACSLQIRLLSSSIPSTRRGSNFYDLIGSPKFFAAPMVGQSDLAFRLLTKNHGTELAFTQMMHARMFVEHASYRQEIDWRDYSPKARLPTAMKITAKELDKNLIVQFAGDSADTLVRAASLVQSDDSVVAVDLNLGCPQNIAKRGHYGAYLLPEKELVISILKAMVKNLDKPVCAKIRCLASAEETLEIAKAIQDTGVSLLTIHGRTIDSKKNYTGPADWEIIRQVKQSLTIPIIANGGVSSYKDAINCLSFTGADGVMSSECLLENPRLFSNTGSMRIEEDYIASQISVANEYLCLLRAYPVNHGSMPHVARSHIFKMLYRLLDAPRNTDLRDRLALGSIAEMQSVLEDLTVRTAGYVSDGPAGIKRALEDGYLGPTLWYMRHRDSRAMQRMVSTPRTSGSMASRASATDQQQLKSRLLAVRAAREAHITALP